MPIHRLCSRVWQHVTQCVQIYIKVSGACAEARRHRLRSVANCAVQTHSRALEASPQTLTCLIGSFRSQEQVNQCKDANSKHGAHNGIQQGGRQLVVVSRAINTETEVCRDHLASSKCNREAIHLSRVRVAMQIKEEHPGHHDPHAAGVKQSLPPDFDGKAHLEGQTCHLANDDSRHALQSNRSTGASVSVHHDADRGRGVRRVRRQEVPDPYPANPKGEAN
mmetsp:Transcript_29530/g.80783  ORF Transcript_29530/g.80783 Transcript_29530/m.80783 type:complete len:222 (-) Transcript_29530:197-862(-)